MSAHVPRSLFAPSLVVIASTTHCEKANNNFPPNPPPPEATQSAPATSAPATSAASDTTPAAKATPNAPTATAADEWQVSSFQGKCMASRPSTCPRGAMCNPPPPQPYECPKGIPEVSYPITVTQAAGATTCKATYMQFHDGGGCPPNATCNPPPPTKVTTTVPCPP